MSIRPLNPDGIVADRLNGIHLELRRVHLEGVVRGFGPGRRAMRAGAGRAGTMVAEPGQVVGTMMLVLPVDVDAAGFGDGDVFGVGTGHRSR